MCNNAIDALPRQNITFSWVTRANVKAARSEVVDDIEKNENSFFEKFLVPLGISLAGRLHNVVAYIILRFTVPSFAPLKPERQTSILFGKQTCEPCWRLDGYTRMATSSRLVSIENKHPHVRMSDAYWIKLNENWERRREARKCDMQDVPVTIKTSLEYYDLARSSIPQKNNQENVILMIIKEKTWLRVPVSGSKLLRKIKLCRNWWLLAILR